MTDVPSPGSEEAIQQGCTCPVLDNAHGQGAQGTWDQPEDQKLFWFHEDCPLHKEFAKPPNSVMESIDSGKWK